MNSIVLSLLSIGIISEERELNPRNHLQIVCEAEFHDGSTGSHYASSDPSKFVWDINLDKMITRDFSGPYAIPFREEVYTNLDFPALADWPGHFKVRAHFELPIFKNGRAGLSGIQLSLGYSEFESEQINEMYNHPAEIETSSGASLKGHKANEKVIWQMLYVGRLKLVVECKMAKIPKQFSRPRSKTCSHD